MRISLYSQKEALFQRQRQRLFAPLFSLFTRVNITPLFLTAVGLLCGLIAAILVPFHLRWSAIFLLLHLLFDMMDGSYARYEKTASDKGAFLDIASDMIVILALALALIFTRALHPVIGAAFLFVYLVLVIFLIARNQMNIPAPFSLRMRPVFYVTFFVFVLFEINPLSLVLGLATAIMTIGCIADAYAIHQKLS